ncbi:copine-3 [Aplysia californica]|uniref:Copine-3 n=1 Tax=Aplysia californica TaxID=6500 RepID=A0ABM1VWT0_APLCA|nr:copine-3 [Aplysia californica]XP_005103026.1 copine-3 [Aplysia californica]XP_035826872.1 copine-3 [Aplysia californica]
MASHQPGYLGYGAANQLVQKVELRVSCKNLLNKDVTSKSDPCAVLYFKEGGKFREFARTENVKNELDPKFVTPFNVEYHFEAVQNIRIRIYDVDNSTEELSDDDFLGQIECSLGQVVSSSPYTKPLQKKSGEVLTNSIIVITAEEVKEGCELAMMRFRAKKLDNKDFMGKSDPFLEVSVPQADGNWQVIHRTEVVKDNLNPEWRPFTVRVQTLCGNDPSRPIRFSVFDWDGDGSHDLIGNFTSTYEELKKAIDSEVTWPCINEKKKEKKKSYKDSGSVSLSTLKIKKEYSFLDFIFGGLQINLTFGVDFTGSNGNPRQPGTLHFIDFQNPNEYMQAIRAVGNVLQDYDSDKLFPALGFGAGIPPNNQVSFEFPLNFNPQNPFCAGIQGVLDTYVNCMQHIQLYGPTNVAPIIHHVARFAAQAQQWEMQGKGAGMYYILLLLTDGILSDMGDVRNAIVYASGLPMSIIIVGVGLADFSDMNQLDGDDGVLKSTSREPVKRDIVQFVPFRDFKNSSPADLARHVLAEVPKQVTGYFAMRDLPPNVVPQAGPPPPAQ